MSIVEPGLEGLSRQEKVALLKRLERQKPTAARTFPLSFAQQRMWFLDRLDPGNPANNIFRAVTFTGSLDAPVLARVLAEIVRRHGALRTIFPIVGDEPRQHVNPAAGQPLPRIDLSGLPAARRETVARDLAGREARHAFDLARGPLFRTVLLRLAAAEHILFLGLHHIVADGWSLGLLFGELTALYRAFVSGRPSPLPALAIQYPDFAAWQREHMAGERLRFELDACRERIGEARTVLELPADRLRPAVESFRGGLERFSLPAAVENGVRALGRESRATLFMTLLAAFEVLLYRYTRQPSFLIGTTVAGRDRPEVEELIGLFANTLLLPADLAGKGTFRDLLGEVRRSTLDAYSHQELPFESLVLELHPERDLSHNPLFQVMFALQNLPEREISLPGLTLGELDVERGLAKLDLTLDLTDSNAGSEGIAGYFEYSTDLFEAATIARMTGCFLTLLAGIVAAPDRPLAELPLLDRAERERILFGFNPTSYELLPLVSGRIAAQARSTPEAPAVLFGDERLSYADLNARANRLARALRRRGVGPDTRVGLCLERSLGLAVALLGILKAGAGYVPLDPAYPRERLALMIEDTGMTVLVTVAALVAQLPVEVGGPALLLLDAEEERIAAEDASDPDWEILGEGLAYVVYTSGSTGRPKGVGVPHRALANHAAECARVYGLGPADRVLQFTSLSFDITSEEVFPTWISGAALVPRAPGLFPSFAELETLLDRHSVTVVNLPTAYWHEWASELHRTERRPPASLRLAIIGTEQALPERLAEWLTLPALPGLPGGAVRFANSYASTECTVTALIHLSGPGSLERARAGHRIPVGRPIGNCRVYVLDAAMEPVPAGVPGDVYIGGANVSRGYLRHPERTAAVFLPDPFGTCGPGGRLYRQGDLGRFLPSGELECLGRSDDQIKVRGFRVEPGEIEATLARHPGVRKCVVLVRDAASPDRRLVGYVAASPEHGASADELRAHLRKSLPEYMVPAGLVVLADLPLTLNGKIDRRALLRIDPLREATGEVGGAAGGGTPVSPVEELVLQIWSQVLRRERIGRHDNFFDLGGHSLLVTQVISRVRQALGVDLPLRTLFEEPTVAAFAVAVESARRSAGGVLAPPIEPIPAELRQGPLPSSFAQQRLWVVDQLTPGSPAYNLSDALRFTGALDVATLSRALDEIVRRHEVLRTTFTVIDGEALQVISPPAPLALRSVDLTAKEGLRSDPRTGAWLRGAPEGAGPQDRTEPVPAEERVMEVAAEEGRRPFDLGRGPLFRATLYRLAPEDHLLLLGLHHSVSDGNSSQILLSELLALYTAFSRGEASPLPDLPVQYADYAAWQRAWLRGETLAAQIAYWRRQLEGAPPVLALPTDRPRPAVESAAGDRHTFSLEPGLARDLETLGRREGATRFMTLLAGFDALLARWSGQDDLVVGWPIAGRDRAEVSGVIGFFSNMLVQRARLTAGLSFARLLGQVRGTALDAYSHGDLPFELLVSALRPERDLSHNPIFQAFFVLHHQEGAGPTIPGVAVHLPHIATGTSLLDLSFAVTETATSLDAVFEYKTALFDRATVERMAGHLTNLLASAVAAPGAPLAELPMLSAAERRQLVEGFSDTASEVPAGTTAHGLFAARAAAAPGALALVTEGELLTYGELETRANRLAHRLRRLGVKPGVLVGICLERGAAMVAALLAVQKSGGAYVPLDPTYPAERLAYILADGDIPFLLTTGDLAAVLPLHDAANAAILDLDDPYGEVGPEALGSESAAPPAPLGGPEDLAYVLYTSGSTGKPKGVEVRHAGLTNFLLGMARRPGLEETDTLLAVTTISFDIAGLEIYLPLAVGGRVVLASRAAASDGRRLAALLDDCGATAMQATPATWRLLLDSGWGEKRALKALCGGEALPAGLARELLSRVGSLWNLYGPTETTIWSALQPVTVPMDGTPSTVPIGFPIENTALHLLDRTLGLVPQGVVGELYIGGAGLARGYLRRPALTAERFVPDPFAGPGARLYRTGDLGRRLPGGEIEFLGRADNQVKVRGFRIELGEIEAALEAHPAVRQAVVAVHAEGASTAQLVAYVVPAGVAAAQAGPLRAALREELPEPMVPSLFVFLTELPLTPNGKVDRRALPSPTADSLGPTRERIAPRTPVELRVAAVWAEILGMPEISIHDNFFELGGHSLMATQVISRLEEAFRVELGLPAIFKAPTVAALSEAIEIQRQREAPIRTAIPRVSREPGLFRLSFAQERLWFLNQYEPESPEYNIPQGFRISGPLSAAILRRSLETIVARHEALRTTFRMIDGVPMQVVAPCPFVDLPETDFRPDPGLTPDEREAAVRRIAYEDARLPFDLSVGPPFRALLFRLDDSEHLFFLNVHHIAYDGWSRGVLLAELAALYGALAAGLPSSLPELPVQYLDFALWQRDWLSGEALDRQLSYWRERLAGTPPLDLVPDRPRPPFHTYNGASEPMFFDRPLVESLTRLGQAEGGTLYVSLAAAWKALLHHYTGQEDLAVGTLLANRTRPELEGLIGVFANTLALRTDLSGDPSFRQLVAREREVALGAYAHQDLPFEKLIDEIHPERDLARSPIFQTLLILLNTPAQALDIPGLRLSELAIDNATAKFEMTLYMVAETAAEEGLAGYLEYNTDLFDAATVRRFLDHFKTLAAGVAADPGQPLSALPWLAANEARQLLADWNATAADFPRDRALHGQIAEQAARTPEAVAVELEGARLTYAELDSRANRLARYLRRLGVGPEVRVGLAVERSFDMVVALLGILKAGGAYVPLDPEYPRERLAFLLEDSRLSLLLTEERLLAKLPATGARILVLDRDRERTAIAAEENRAPESGVEPRNLAYVLYTSGSTGKPKGVQISHRAVVNFLASMSRRPGMTSADTLLAVTTLSFDIAGLEIYLPLVTGARVVLVPREVAQAGELLLDRLVRSAATVMQATPATWRLLVEAGFAGDSRLTILCGGEALPPDLADALGASRSLWNVYGPTETTIWSMLQEIAPGDRITLGRPLDNTEVYLLSRSLLPVPVGVPGELHIGGAGLARGYQSRPDLSAERFRPHPFSDVPGARLYQTGDLGRHLPDGTVEHLGRIDSQVKVRGFRIELGEVETVLARCSGVGQAVVLAREDVPGRKRLVAYVVPRVPGEAPKSSELREFLLARLPEYMLPAFFVTLQALPLTPNGKVDRRRLPAPDGNRASERPYEAPSSPVEEALAVLWAEALGVSEVGRHDDFFELGGDSLLAIRVVSRANRDGFGITVRQLFQNRTLAEIAEIAEIASGSGA